jgi:hypothetical protein
MSLDNTAEFEVEQAIVSRMETVFDGDTVEVVGYVGSEQAVDLNEDSILVPCVMIVATPFVPYMPGRDFGDVTVRLSARTNADADADRTELERIWRIASAAMTEATIGPLIDEPWLLCGLDDTETGGGGETGDRAGSRFQEKSKVYTFKMDKVAT